MHMMLTEFFLAAEVAGVRLVDGGGGRLELRGPAGAIGPEIREAAREHRGAILTCLSPVPTGGPGVAGVHFGGGVVGGGTVSGTVSGGVVSSDGAVGGPVVVISGRSFSYQRPWDGRPLTGRGLLAFDTETEVIVDEVRIPRLALASASAGDGASAVIRPDQVGRFIRAHPEADWVFHNAAFDFWVIDQYLHSAAEVDTRRAWWDACDQNRMHDTMILDQLIELARRDGDPRPRDLAIVGRAYAGLEISKDDPYRKRYGEIIGRDWAEVEEGFFTYAIKDPIVTLHAYRRMIPIACGLMGGMRRISPDTRVDMIGRFGPLSETVQVKGAIALADLTRRGMHLDRELVQSTEEGLRRERDRAVDSLRDLCPALFKVKRDRATGQIGLQYSKTGAPAKHLKVLQGQLAAIVDELDVSVPYTKRGLSTSVKVWSEYVDLHPFLGGWIELEELSKLCQFFDGMREAVVHPRYRPLLRTGRTSCSGPNIQQIPRTDRFRHCFVASPGHLLLAIDYSFIELVTLAAVCLQRYGRSALADVIRDGRDPHAHTAAMILGVPYEEFLSWKDDEDVVDLNGRAQPRRLHFKDARQLAKPVNFGVPGGLGVASLVAYARHTYKVEMTAEQAGELRSRLITEIYPELGAYLAEDGMTLLARNLGASPRDLWDAFDPEGTRSRRIPMGIRNVVRGRELNAKGEPYNERYVARVWNVLAMHCRDPELRRVLSQWQAGEPLGRRLFGTGVVTLTGRIRGNVTYSQCRNTPFQGAAADGAKLALWRLIREGFRVIGFIHDEVLIELPDEGGYVSLAVAEYARQIMIEEMESVLVGGIGVRCEMALSRRWGKDAGSRARDGRLYPA
jgi:hypothetical protein